jgi:hypothetical protein
MISCLLSKRPLDSLRRGMVLGNTRILVEARGAKAPILRTIKRLVFPHRDLLVRGVSLATV